MTPREATIQNLKSLKGQPLKEQLRYIFTNFWIPIVAVSFVIVLLFSLVIHWATQKPTVLTLCCINMISEEADTDNYLQCFAQAQGIDTNKNTLMIHSMYFGHDAESDYQYFQAFTAMQMAGELDVMIADHETVIDYAYLGFFSDLTESLTQEQLQALSPHLLYMDLTFYENMDPYTEVTPIYPDPTKPEEMDRPVPVAIKLQPEWDFSKAYYPYTHHKNAIALFVNAKNMTNAEAFLQYILGHEGN